MPREAALLHRVGGKFDVNRGIRLVYLTPNADPELMVCMFFVGAY